MAILAIGVALTVVGLGVFAVGVIFAIATVETIGMNDPAAMAGGVYLIFGLAGLAAGLVALAGGGVLIGLGIKRLSRR